MDASKYKKMYFPVPLRDRKWPGRELTKPPKWCSVDLRDGNQALETPMSLSEKLDYFRMLVEIGFKEDAFSPIVWNELPESESWFIHG